MPYLPQPSLFDEFAKCAKGSSTKFFFSKYCLRGPHCPLKFGAYIHTHTCWPKNPLLQHAHSTVEEKKKREGPTAICQSRREMYGCSLD